MEQITTVGIDLAKNVFSLHVLEKVCVSFIVDEIDDGIWNVYFGPLKLGRLDDWHMRNEDEYGRLRRNNV